MNENIYSSNRAFLYGDALFETILVKNNHPIYFKEHYFRLLSGMRQLKMEIPFEFNWDMFSKSVLNFIQNKNLFQDSRLRITVFRNSEGLYLPLKSEIGYTMELLPIKMNIKEKYSLGVYKDNMLNNNSIDNIKTTNRLINVLANIYANHNNFDNVVLLNHKKNVVSASNANIFIVKNNEILTPALNEGCIAGIIRLKVIDDFSKMIGIQIIETNLALYQLQEADEIFITNSIVGIQPITIYKGKTMNTIIGKKLIEIYNNDVNSTLDFPVN